MEFSSLFSVNGVLATARLESLVPMSSVSLAFRNRACLTYDVDAIVSVPLGSSVFTCQLPLVDGHHGEDLLLGQDWLELYRQDPSYIGRSSPQAGSCFITVRCTCLI